MDQDSDMAQAPVEENLLDGFRTQIHIGMDQAAEMLSRFLQPRYNFRIQLIPVQSEATDRQQKTQAGVCLQIEGDVTGAILLLFAAEDACRLAGLLLRQDPPIDLSGEPLRSTLREVGNIFVSGVLASFDDRMKLRALPLPPTFLSGSRMEVEGQCQKNCQQHDAFLVQARLECYSPTGVHLEGTIFFQVTEESLRRSAGRGNLAGVASTVPS